MTQAPFYTKTDHVNEFNLVSEKNFLFINVNLRKFDKIKFHKVFEPISKKTEERHSVAVASIIAS